MSRQPPRSDPQRDRVYAMDSEAIGGGAMLGLSRRDIRKVVRAISRAFKITEPRVIFGDLGSMSGAWQDSVVAFNTKNRRPDIVTVAHEMAHHLHEMLAPGNGDEDHGPQFMCCYISILDAMQLVPVSGMRGVCKEYRLKFIDPGSKSSLQTLKRRLKRKK